MVWVRDVTQVKYIIELLVFTQDTNSELLRLFDPPIYPVFLPVNFRKFTIFKNQHWYLYPVDSVD